PLPDLDAWNLDWRAGKGPDQCHRTRTEIVVIVFGFRRPVIPKRPFNTATHSPARSRLAGRFLLGEHGDGKRIFVVSPGRTALAVYHPAIPRPAEPSRRTRKPICFGVCRSGDSLYRLRCVASNVGCRAFALDADYPTAKLKIAADLAASERAESMARNGNTRHYRGNGYRLVGPSCARMGSDITARPGKRRT